MMKSVKFLLIVLGLAFILPLESCAVTYPHPVHHGPNFVWVAPRTTPGGVVIPGHWVYRGKPYKNKVWVPGHYNRRGHWIHGHWKTIKRPRHGAVWVPGHWNRRGVWISGHWRVR